MVFSAGGAVAADDQTPLRSIWSCSHRFLLTGTNSAYLANAARWAEDIADAIERSFGIKTSPDRDAVFRIVLNSDTIDSISHVRKSHVLRANSQFQQLDFGPLDHVDWEQAIESFCFLILSRHVTDLWLAEGKVESPAAVPDWVAVGLARNLDSALKRHDRRITLRLAKKGQLPPFSEVSTWDSLPEGRDARKSVAGMALGWLMTKSILRKSVVPLTAELAAGRELTADRIARQTLKFDSVDEMNSDWFAWVEDQKSIVSPLDGITTDLVDDLKRTLLARPGESGIPESGALPRPAELEQLVRLKKKRWLDTFCTYKSRELEVFCIGRPAEVVATVKAYLDFLEALSQKRRDGVILQLLVKADAMLRELEKTAISTEQADGMVIPAESQPSPLPPKH